MHATKFDFTIEADKFTKEMAMYLVYTDLKIPFNETIQAYGHTFKRTLEMTSYYDNHYLIVDGTKCINYYSYYQGD